MRTPPSSLDSGFTSEGWPGAPTVQTLAEEAVVHGQPIDLGDGNNHELADQHRPLPPTGVPLVALVQPPPSHDNALLMMDEGGRCGANACGSA